MAHGGLPVNRSARPVPTAAGVAGLIVLAASWLGPLPAWTARSFAAHMTLHMLVVAVAAPLIAIGMAGSRWDPVPRAPRFFAPIPLSVLELIVVWGWHAPGLHHWARHHSMGLALEQGMFFAAGLLLWISAFGGQSADGGGAAALGRGAGAGVAGLLLTSMHMTLLGALLALAPRPLYPHAHAAAASSGRPAAWTPLEDQHVGGAIMLVVGGVAYLAGGLALTFRLLQASRPSPRSRASTVARGADSPPPLAP
jgi:putative membrane protein